MAGQDTRAQVLLVGDYPPPHGGISLHVQSLHRALKRRGIGAVVLDIGKGGRPAPDVLPVRTALRLAQEVRAHASRGCVVHLHTSGDNRKAWALVGAVGALCVPFGGRSLVTLHSGLLPERLVHGGQAPLARAALAPYAAVVAVSARLQEALGAAGVRPAKISVVSPFVASELRPGDPPELLKRARARYSPLLSCQNSAAPVYGRKLLLEAVAGLAGSHPELGLALFGGCAPGDALALHARALGLADRLVDLGELEHTQALAVIAASDVFVRPTLADGDSLSVREAVALGVACVASDAAERPPGVSTFSTGDVGALEAALREAFSARPSARAGPDALLPLLELYRHVGGGPAAAGGRARTAREEAT